MSGASSASGYRTPTLPASPPRYGDGSGGAAAAPPDDDSFSTTPSSTSSPRNPAQDGDPLVGAANLFDGFDKTRNFQGLDPRLSPYETDPLPVVAKLTDKKAALKQLLDNADQAPFETIPQIIAQLISSINGENKGVPEYIQFLTKHRFGSNTTPKITNGAIAALFALCVIHDSKSGKNIFTTTPDAEKTKFVNDILEELKLSLTPPKNLEKNAFKDCKFNNYCIEFSFMNYKNVKLSLVNLSVICTDPVQALRNRTVITALLHIISEDEIDRIPAVVIVSKETKTRETLRREANSSLRKSFASTSEPFVQQVTVTAAEPYAIETQPPLYSMLTNTGHVLVNYFHGAQQPQLEVESSQDAAIPKVDKESCQELKLCSQLRNVRMAELNISRLQHSNPVMQRNFERTFRAISGVTFLEFLAIIYSEPASSIPAFVQQSITPAKLLIGSEGAKFVNHTVVMDNTKKSLTQQFLHPCGMRATTTVHGTKTFSSNALDLDSFIFERPEYDDVFGINHNYREITVLDHMDKIHHYPMHTIGSYKNKDNSSKNATCKASALLATAFRNYKPPQPTALTAAASTVDETLTAAAPEQTVSAQAAIPPKKPDTVVVLDFKPLKGIKGFHDKKVFENHVSILTEAVSKLSATYCPVWGNSRGSGIENIMVSTPDSNTAFHDQIIPWFGQNIPDGHKLRPLFAELKRLTEPPTSAKSPPASPAKSPPASPAKDTSNVPAPKKLADAYKSRSHFIKIFTITRILAANFPEKFILIGGCMSAKDRMQSLVYASEIIIQIYHVKRNLDFLDSDGRLDPAKLDKDDMDFLKMHINNIIGQNFLSFMGIGKFNNKNLDLLAELFQNVPTLKSAFSKEKLIDTDA